MPISQRWDAGQRLLVVEVSGAPTDAELLEFAERVTSDPAIPPGRRELIDLRSLEGTGQVTAGTLRRIADAFTASDEKPEESRVAVVAPANVAYGLSRMYQAYRSDSPVSFEIFRDLPSARRWLGLPEEG